MKFEFLPNEIFIECFQYLNGLDIFHSFNQLNNRFNQLIQNIPLHLDFENMNKTTFDRLCSKIFFNPNIKLWIISLKLFNTAGYDQIKKFISYFPFNRFRHLRSLTLIGLRQNHVEAITLMLLLLTNLTYFNFPDLMKDPSEIMSALQMSKVKILSMPNLNFDLDFSPEMTMITNLTILFCYPVHLFQLFKYTPMLKYLNIECLGNGFNTDMLVWDHSQVVYLKQLIIDEYNDTFEHLDILLRKASNLKIFSIITDLYQMNMLDADYWQCLITCSLPHLDVFNFKFIVCFYENYDRIMNAFQNFQTDFWHKKHHWYTMHEFHDGFALIYTVPYV